MRSTRLHTRFAFWFRIGIIPVLTCANAGCQDLNVTPLCTSTPDDPRCPKDSATEDTSVDVSVDVLVDTGAEDGAIDGVIDNGTFDVEPEVSEDTSDSTVDAGFDTSTDTSADTIVDTTVDSAADTRDATPDSAADISLPDTLTDTAECATGAVDTTACGKCGKQSRSCVAGKWSAFGACGSEGLCVAGATGTDSSTCAFFEVGTTKCSATCTLDVTCTAKKGWMTLAAPPAGVALGPGEQVGGVQVDEYVVTGNGSAIYNIRTNTWRVPDARPSGASFDVYSGKVSNSRRAWFFGGSSVTPSKGLYSLDPVSGTWRTEPTPSFLVPQSEASALVVGDKLLFGYGRVSGSLTDSGGLFSPSTFIWTSGPTSVAGWLSCTSVQPTETFGMALDDGKVWSFTTSKVTQLDDGLIYKKCAASSKKLFGLRESDRHIAEWTGSSWTPRANGPLRTAFYPHFSCDETSCILYGGLEGGTTGTSTVDVYTIATNTWKTIADAPQATKIYGFVATYRGAFIYWDWHINSATKFQPVMFVP